MMLFGFEGGRRFLGGRAQWTDWRLPIVGCRACPWWSRGGRRGGGEGDTILCSVSRIIIICYWWHHRCSDKYVCMCIFSSFFPPQQFLSHQPLAAAQSVTLLSLVAWRTNSRSFPKCLQMTHQVRGVFFSFYLLLLELAFHHMEFVGEGGNGCLFVFCPSETGGGSSHNSPDLSGNRLRPVCAFFTFFWLYSCASFLKW